MIELAVAPFYSNYSIFLEEGEGGRGEKPSLQTHLLTILERRGRERKGKKGRPPL